LLQVARLVVRVVRRQARAERAGRDRLVLVHAAGDRIVVAAVARGRRVAHAVRVRVVRRAFAEAAPLVARHGARAVAGHAAQAHAGALAGGARLVQVAARPRHARRDRARARLDEAGVGAGRIGPRGLVAVHDDALAVDRDR